MTESSYYWYGDAGRCKYRISYVVIVDAQFVHIGQTEQEWSLCRDNIELYLTDWRSYYCRSDRRCRADTEEYFCHSLSSVIERNASIKAL